MVCPDGVHACPDGNTCCMLRSGDWGCCPLPHAVCCSDGLHCCPEGTTCDPSGGRCLQTSSDGMKHLLQFSIKGKMNSVFQYILDTNIYISFQILSYLAVWFVLMVCMLALIEILVVS